MNTETTAQTSQASASDAATTAMAEFKLRWKRWEKARHRRMEPESAKQKVKPKPTIPKTLSEMNRFQRYQYRVPSKSVSPDQKKEAPQPVTSKKTVTTISGMNRFQRCLQYMLLKRTTSSSSEAIDL